MIRTIASRRLAASSSLLKSTNPTGVLPKPSPAASKRFGHGHHDPEYPAESLFNKTSIFVTVFSVFTTGLILNDYLNSKTGKSLIGDWLIPSPKEEAIAENRAEGIAELETFRKDRLFQRSITEKPKHVVPTNIKYADFIP